jgi:hypothetical protein
MCREYSPAFSYRSINMHGPSILFLRNFFKGMKSIGRRKQALVKKTITVRDFRGVNFFLFLTHLLIMERKATWREMSEAAQLLPLATALL